MIISEWISQFSHLLSVAMLITMFGSMCCFARLKCQWFCNRKLFLCHKYHSGKHGAIPQEREREREMLPKPNYTVLLKPSVSHCVHLHELGEQARLLFIDWRNILHFFLCLGFHELQRRKIHSEILLLFGIFQKYPTDFRHSSSLSTSACVIHWQDIWGTAVGEWGFTDVINTDLHKCRNTQQKHIQ